jgi:ketosteroid isomerase-like protein
MEGEAGIFRGHDGMRTWLADLHELYEGLESTIVETRDLGERVVISFVVRGTGRGSGITLEQPLTQVVTLRDGKVIEVREFLSLEEALAAFPSAH